MRYNANATSCLESILHNYRKKIKFNIIYKQLTIGSVLVDRSFSCMYIYIYVYLRIMEIEHK